MTELPEPAASQVVLIGAATYTHLTGLPGVRGNVEDLAATFADPDLWGVPPGNLHVLLDEADPAVVSDALWSAAAAVGDRGLLLVYYAGHGLVDPRTERLVLALSGTNPRRPHERGLPFDWVQRALLDGGAQRRVVILDCCYGGRAGSEMAGDASAADAVADQAMTEATCLLVAASANRTASAPEGEPHTAFTGELIRVLREGVADGDPTLTIEVVWGLVRQALAARGFERPELRESNAGGNIALVRNVRAAGDDLTGAVLHAAPSLADPELHRAAVLVLRHNATGAVGVRLTRLDGPLPADFPEHWRPLVNEPAVLFDGGPVARDGYIVVTRLRSGVAPPLRFVPVRDRLGTLTLSALPEDIRPKVYELRVFVGYLGWGPGELETHLDAGELLRSRTPVSRLLSGGPLDVWQKARDGG
jgi:putative transcriptional regulator